MKFVCDSMVLGDGAWTGLHKRVGNGYLAEPEDIQVVPVWRVCAELGGQRGGLELFCPCTSLSKIEVRGRVNLGIAVVGCFSVKVFISGI